MNSVFKIKPYQDEKIQEYKDKAIKELNAWFEVKWTNNTPKIFVVDDRETINMLREEETENWVVGWSWGRLAICILNPKNISAESCHDGATYSIEKLIKHELCHSYFQMSFGRSNFDWINEGVSIYVAGQLDKYKMPSEFTGFLDNKNVYQESGSVIKLLMDHFGKEKLFVFFKKQRDIKDRNQLDQIFKSVYEAELSYAFFNDLKKI